MNPFSSEPIGTPGQPWGAAERAQWRSRLQQRRRYAQDVLRPLEGLRTRWELLSYGEVAYASERYPLLALRSPVWHSDRPAVLVTGGVHGYETSGVQGALHFLQQHASDWAGRVNLLVVPCVSPWAYERIHRWNFDAIDPNRAFRQNSAAQESAALMQLVAQVQRERGVFAAHIDLHETTDTDETDYRPALAARDGQPFVPGSIPDGFYLVDDAQNPQPAFQQAIIQAVEQVTHIAQPDENGELIGSPMVAPGVIHYPFKTLGLCAGVSGARLTSTTEVYPDSPRATAQQCIAAQVAAVNAALAFVENESAGSPSTAAARQ